MVSRYEMMVLRGKGAALTASGGATYLAWTDGKFRLDDIVNPLIFGLTVASFKFHALEHAITGWTLTKVAQGMQRFGKASVRAGMSVGRVAGPPVGLGLAIAAGVVASSAIHSEFQERTGRNMVYNPTPFATDFGTPLHDMLSEFLF